MEVYLGNTLVPVKIIRKNNKNIYFRFDDDFNLVVTANRLFSEREIEKIILKNEKSLARMLEKFENKRIKDSEFWYLGNKYDIIYDGASEVEFNEGVITCKDESTLEKFVKRQIKDIFNYEVNKLRSVIKTPDFTLKFRKMKTRWGVCNYKLKTITLNTELIKYRKDLLRYVIIHEMCHFYHHNHGEKFWNMVSLYYPNYKEARKELKY